MSRGGVLLAAAIIFGAAFFLTSYALSPPTETIYIPPPKVGEELGIVLIVSPFCRWSNDPSLPGIWEAFKNDLEQVSASSGITLSLLGVSANGTPAEGYDMLSRFGSFDEIASGRALNAGALRYMHSDFRGQDAYPQVVVVRRQLAYRPDGSIFRQSEEVLHRFVGLRAIQRASKRPPDYLAHLAAARQDSVDTP